MYFNQYYQKCIHLEEADKEILMQIWIKDIFTLMIKISWFLLIKLLKVPLKIFIDYNYSLTIIEPTTTNFLNNSIKIVMKIYTKEICQKKL